MNLDARIAHAAATRTLSDELFVDVVHEDLVSRHMLGELEPHVTADSVARIFVARDKRGRVIRLGSKSALLTLERMVQARLLEKMDERRFALPEWNAVDSIARVDHWDARKRAESAP